MEPKRMKLSATTPEIANLRALDTFVELMDGLSRDSYLRCLRMLTIVGVSVDNLDAACARLGVPQCQLEEETNRWPHEECRIRPGS